MNPCFVLATDFGKGGPYVGQLHAAIRRRIPDSAIVDLQHDLPSFRPRGAGILLSMMTAWMPDGATVVGVVDPGVGTSRRGLILESGGRVFVGPDNGLFGPLLGGATRIVEIGWKPAFEANTFHARDWFVPVAIRLALGEDVPGLPIAAADCVGSDWDSHLAEVIYEDGFGNLMLGIQGEAVDPATILQAGGHGLAYAETFADVGRGEAFWYVNSIGLVELAVNQGSAAELLGLKVGDPVSGFDRP